MAVPNGSYTDQKMSFLYIKNALLPEVVEFLLVSNTKHLDLEQLSISCSCQ